MYFFLYLSLSHSLSVSLSFVISPSFAFLALIVGFSHSLIPYSLFLVVCFPLSVSLCLSLSFSLSLSLSLSPCLHLSHSLLLFVSLSPSLSLCLPLPSSISLSHLCPTRSPVSPLPSFHVSLFTAVCVSFQSSQFNSNPPKSTTHKLALNIAQLKKTALLDGINCFLFKEISCWNGFESRRGLWSLYVSTAGSEAA